MTKQRIMRVATTQLSLAAVDSPQIYWKRVEHLIAAGAGAAVVLLPEYASLSLMLADSSRACFKERLVAYAQNGAQLFEAKIHELACAHHITVVAGSVPWIDSDDRLMNRCMVAFPDGSQVVQNKINMTRFESENWGIFGGEPVIHVFTLAGARCAVAICYDVEFLAVSAALARAGVELLFVPSCTDDMHGYWRVRHCTHARTIENQCYAVISSVVDGDLRYGHYGQGAILSPCDLGYPLRGLLKEGDLNIEGVTWADLDLDLLAKTRRDGTVLNLRDGSSGTTVTTTLA